MWAEECADRISPARVDGFGEGGVATRYVERSSLCLSLSARQHLVKTNDTRQMRPKYKRHVDARERWSVKVLVSGFWKMEKFNEKEVV